MDKEKAEEEGAESAPVPEADAAADNTTAADAEPAEAAQADVSHLIIENFKFNAFQA